VAFDPRGHGESSGTIEGLTLERHLEDLASVHAFARDLHPRIIGIGSSLGALALAAFAAKDPRSIEFFVGIGAAFGFYERWSRVPASQRPAAMTAKAMRSARGARTAVLARRFRVPALLWHGMRDDAVPWQHCARFAAAAEAPIELRLLSAGDHRLTQWKELIAAESAARAIQQLQSKE
jgi:pimeloyl-ACP methyl ester carboxylesterase